MKVFHDIGVVPQEYQGGVVVLGNFDGVHRGHQIVLSKAREIATAADIAFGVMSFEPHPRAFFAPHKNLFRLSPPNIKPQLIDAVGADFLKIYGFDADFSSLSARAFVEKTLIEHLGVHTVVCGHDFHFGKGREGTPEMLVQFGREFGFDVEIVSAQKSEKEDRLFSSSSIRADLRDGKLSAAAHDLGRWWSMRGSVQTGEGQGTFLGFPTANIALDPTCELRPGIYAARLREFGHEGARVIDGAAYIGTKPTFGEFDPRLEIFLFDFEGDIYGKDVLVEFISFLRDDQKFDTSQALTQQMKKDCADAAQSLKEIFEEGDPMAAHEMGRFFMSN